MEVAEIPYEIIGDHEREQRFVELSLRSLLLSQHEQFAQQVEFLDGIDFLTPDQRAEKKQLESLYRQETGASVADRAELERRIESSIATGCHETLEEILAAFN